MLQVFLQLNSAAADATVLLVMADTRSWLAIPHLPHFLQHLTAQLQWRRPFGEIWDPVFVSLAVCKRHISHGLGPELLAVIRVLAPTANLVLLDHDTLFTARWEIEKIRRLAVLDAFMPTTPHLGRTAVMNQEQQMETTATPWACSRDGVMRDGTFRPHTVGAFCFTERQPEANGAVGRTH